MTGSADALVLIWAFAMLFAEPCNNCAFRPGSNEQADRETWISLIQSLKQGASFYCHKGVPIEAGAKHGFAYPADRAKLRLCRGYLNALKGIWKHREPSIWSEDERTHPQPKETAP